MRVYPSPLACCHVGAIIFFSRLYHLRHKQITRLLHLRKCPLPPYGGDIVLPVFTPSTPHPPHQKFKKIRTHPPYRVPFCSTAFVFSYIKTIIGRLFIQLIMAARRRAQKSRPLSNSFKLLNFPNWVSAISTRTFSEATHHYHPGVPI